MDPLDAYQDEMLWENLAKVQLKDMVKNSPDKLELQLAEEGSNVSFINNYNIFL